MPNDEALWQSFAPAGRASAADGHHWAEMPDGTRLRLPLRDFGDSAVAGFIANQASFAVLDQLNAWVAARAARHGAEVVVGLPTLGHVVAQGVARALGHANWVAAGFSRKLWYEEALSVPVSSITAPGERRMWLDPRVVHRLRGRRVLLADDVISTGRSMQAGLALLRAAGVTPVAACVAMIQGDCWQAEWDAALPICGAFATPLFRRGGEAWVARPETVPESLCQP